MAPLALAILLGCPSTTPEPTPAEDLPCESDSAVVELTTEDALRLAADYLPAQTQERAAVVLFHMIPPSNDRSTWPVRVREALAALDVSVLTVDRRGAGDSEGEAVDAYSGPGARLDMEAAVRFLLDEAVPCAVDAQRLVLVGASNGTTSVMDYAAGHDATLPDPAGLVWMSPGGYTEAQNRVADARDALEAAAMLWLYPTNEPYSRAFEDDAPAGWEFVERGTRHGTEMFDGGALEDDTLADLLGFIAAVAD